MLAQGPVVQARRVREAPRLAQRGAVVLDQRGMRGLQRQRAFVALKFLCMQAQLAAGRAAVHVGLEGARAQLHRAVEMGQRLAGLAEREQREAQVVLGLEQVRLALQQRAEGLGRGAVLARLLTGHAEVVPALEEFGS